MVVVLYGSRTVSAFKQNTHTGVWLKIKELGLRGCLSLVPFTMVPFWYHSFEPQPYYL